VAHETIFRNKISYNFKRWKQYANLTPKQIKKSSWWYYW